MGSKPWLLILEDEADVAEVTADYLKGQFQVRCAHTIQEARAALRTIGPGTCSVAVFDMRLNEGKEGGLMFAQELRQYTHPPEMIVLTAFPDLNSVDLLMEIGVFGYVVKGNDTTFPTLRKKCLKASARWLQRWHRLPEEQFDHPVAILYGDNMASIDFWETLGNHESRRVKSLWRETVAREIGTREGTIVECTDDWLVAIFTTVSTALEAAVALQQGLPLDLAQSALPSLQPREVVHWDTVVQAKDLEYGRVDMTSPAIRACFRIAETGRPGQILVSQQAREALGTSSGFAWQDHGTHRLRDMPESVRLYELQTMSGAVV